MKKCSNCGFEMDDGFTFCPKCGKKQGCPQCGNTALVAGMPFCPQCGFKITEDAVVDASEQQNLPGEDNGNDWVGSETYLKFERDIDQLISNILTTGEDGEKMAALVRPFLTSHIFSNLIVANTARCHEKNELFYDAYLMNLCDFSMSAEEYEDEVKEQLLLATPCALIDINAVVNSVSQKTGIDLSDIRMNEYSLDNYFLDKLKPDLDDLFREIRKQTSLYPQLNNSMEAVKTKIGRYNSQNFLQRNKDTIINAGVNFARGFFGDPTVIADSIKEFFTDRTDPDYRMYLDSAERIMEIAENGANAAYCLENDLEFLYVDIVLNGDFKNWLLDACKKMIERGIDERVISESIQERNSLHSMFDDGDDAEDEHFRTLDVYNDFFCETMVMRDSIAQQAMWDVSCLMFDFMLMYDNIFYYPNSAEWTLDDLTAKYKELKSAVNFFDNPFKELMRNVVAENLGPVRNEGNASTLYVINGDEESEFDEDKLFAARDKYAPDVMISDILVYYDDTVFGKGDDGFILTCFNLYIKEFGADVQVIPLDDIKEIYWSEKKQWLGSSRFLQINGVDYCCDMDENDLNAFVLGLRTVVAEYQKI